LFQDINRHQAEIFNKLVAIMDTRLVAHLRSLKAQTPWADAVTAENTPSEPLKQIVNDVRKLHKLLKNYVPLSVVQLLMTKVCATYNKRVEEELLKLDIDPFFTSATSSAREAARTRLRADMTWFVQSLSTGLDLAPSPPTSSGADHHSDSRLLAVVAALSFQPLSAPSPTSATHPLPQGASASAQGAAPGPGPAAAPGPGPAGVPVKPLPSKPLPPPTGTPAAASSLAASGAGTAIASASTSPRR